MGMDESGTLAALRAHRRELIDPKIAEHDGRIVKGTGDGLLLEFPSVVDAVRCAVEVQRGMADRNTGITPDQRLDFRIGINVGDIIIDGDDIFGDGVNVAARLEALADPGGICVSRVVRDQVLDKLSFTFEELGAQQVKNIARPVDVYRVALDSGAATSDMRRRWTPLMRAAKWPSRHAGVLITIAVMVSLGLIAWIGSPIFLRPADVAPYSAQDRRMTFAVLPFQAPANDKTGAEVAAAMTEAAFAVEEGKVLWAQVAPRSSVDQALARHATTKELAADLNVHFLIRGNITRAASGYNVQMLVADGATERVLGTQTLGLPAGALMPRYRGDLESALGQLTYYGLQAEVQRARSKPVKSLDVRDLSYRAYVDWGDKKEKKDEKGAYVSATEQLNRALALAPDDPLALFLTAKVNLCDCVNDWSGNVEEQQAIGSAALEKYLQHDPRNTYMLNMKSQLHGLRGRYEESLLINDAILKRDPDDGFALGIKAYDLLKLGRPQEALPAVNALLVRDEYWETLALAAAVNYQLAQYELAAQMAQKATATMSPEELGNRRYGAVRLTLVAAEARLGHASRAKIALADFNTAVPGVQTISEIKKWMHPAADLADYDPLFEGLRLAGVPD